MKRSLSWSKQMRLIMALLVYCLSSLTLESSNLSPSIQDNSILLSVIMRSMTRNYWQFINASKNGATFCKVVSIK
jgi:hypothetical protein